MSSRPAKDSDTQAHRSSVKTSKDLGLLPTDYWLPPSRNHDTLTAETLHRRIHATSTLSQMATANF